MPTDMNAAIRTKRRALDDYMYEPPVDAGAVSADSAEDELGIENMPEDMPVEDIAAALPEGVGAITVLAPGDAAAEDMYTYERQDNGAWMVYPPGVPCEAGKSRIQLDHPATETEYADMDAALGASGATDDEAAEGEAGY